MSEIFDLFGHLGESISNLAKLVTTRFSNNVGESFTAMTTQQWIRLIVVVGGYMLLRPYIIKMGAKHQVKQLEKQHAEEERQAQLSPNDLRGKIGIPEDSDDEEEEEGAQASAADWGKKARKRQRNMIKKMLDAEEKRLQELQEDEEDKDIEKYFVE